MYSIVLILSCSKNDKVFCDYIFDFEWYRCSIPEPTKDLN